MSFICQLIGANFFLGLDSVQPELVIFQNRWSAEYYMIGLYHRASAKFELTKLLDSVHYLGSFDRSYRGCIFDSLVSLITLQNHLSFSLLGLALVDSKEYCSK